MPLSTPLRAALYRLITDLLLIPDCDQFVLYDPVFDTPKYRATIKPATPMTVNSIRKSLNENKYASIDEFEAEMKIIWKNARAFNGIHSLIGKQADRVARAAANKLADIRSHLANRTLMSPMLDSMSSSQWQEKLQAIIDQLPSPDDSSDQTQHIDWFWWPVDLTLFPDYPTVIDAPRDLALIETRVEGGYYSTDPFMLVIDLELVWSNAMVYNGRQGQAFQEAAKLRKIIDMKLPNELKMMQKSFKTMTVPESVSPSILATPIPVPASPAASVKSEPVDKPNTLPEPLAVVPAPTPASLPKVKNEKPSTSKAKAPSNKSASKKSAAQSKSTPPPASSYLSAPPVLDASPINVTECRLLLDELRKVEDLEAFQTLPDRKEWTSYYMQIKKPIAIDTIDTKLTKGVYVTNSEMWADVRLMWTNAVKFNLVDSALGSLAIEYDAKFNRWYADSFPPNPAFPLVSEKEKKKLVVAPVAPTPAPPRPSPPPVPVTLPSPQLQTVTPSTVDSSPVITKTEGGKIKFSRKSLTAAASPVIVKSETRISSHALPSPAPAPVSMSDEMEIDIMGDDQPVVARHTPKAQPPPPPPPVAARMTVKPEPAPAFVTVAVKREPISAPMSIPAAPTISLVDSTIAKLKPKLDHPLLIVYDTDRFLQKLMKEENSGIFHQPVNTMEVHDYLTKVKHPMDLGTIKTKFNSGVYVNYRQLFDDLELVWQNCFTYNGETASLTFVAKDLQYKCHTSLLSLIEQWETRAVFTGSVRTKCESLVQWVWAHQYGIDFTFQLQTLQLWPDYRFKIAQPIDLPAIKDKINSGRYAHFDSFSEDLLRVFSNCIQYWGRDNVLGMKAQFLSLECQLKLKELKFAMDTGIIGLAGAAKQGIAKKYWQNAVNVITHTPADTQAGSGSGSVSGKMTVSDYVKADGVIRNLIIDSRFHLFTKPVDVPSFSESLHDYYTVVEAPMDLSTILRKLEIVDYQFLADFYRDVRLISDNVRTFYQKDANGNERLADAPELRQGANLLDEQFALQWKRWTLQQAAQSPPTATVKIERRALASTDRPSKKSQFKHEIVKPTVSQKELMLKAQEKLEKLAKSGLALPSLPSMESLKASVLEKPLMKPKKIKEVIKPITSEQRRMLIQEARAQSQAQSTLASATSIRSADSHNVSTQRTSDNAMVTIKSEDTSAGTAATTGAVTHGSGGQWITVTVEETRASTTTATKPTIQPIKLLGRTRAAAKPVIVAEDTRPHLMDVDDTVSDVPPTVPLLVSSISTSTVTKLRELRALNSIRHHSLQTVRVPFYIPAHHISTFRSVGFDFVDGEDLLMRASHEAIAACTGFPYHLDHYAVDLVWVAADNNRQNGRELVQLDFSVSNLPGAASSVMPNAGRLLLASGYHLTHTDTDTDSVTTSDPLLTTFDFDRLKTFAQSLRSGGCVGDGRYRSLVDVSAEWHCNTSGLVWTQTANTQTHFAETDTHNDGLCDNSDNGSGSGVLTVYRPVKRVKRPVFIKILSSAAQSTLPSQTMAFTTIHIVTVAGTLDLAVNGMPLEPSPYHLEPRLVTSKTLAARERESLALARARSKAFDPQPMLEQVERVLAQALLESHDDPVRDAVGSAAMQVS